MDAFDHAAQQQAVAAVLASLNMDDPLGYQLKEFAKIWPPYGKRVRQLRDLAEEQVLVFRKRAGGRPYWTLGPEVSKVLAANPMVVS